ncbi:MAG: isoleucine--tRNA ligase [Candidatus Moraniibacteriota bacterium]
MFQKVDPKQSLPKLEEEILRFWDAEKIFEKSVAKDAPAGDFVFYEGPPTANGKPGLHHVLARSFKDIIPRYKTMQGFCVERKAGWDTHGLPVELQVEKALGLKNKQDIENIVPGDARASIIKFNEECKKSVWEYRDLWEKLTRRMGYWVDMEHPYVTYENEYIESVWWQLAQIAKIKIDNQEVLYKGHKVMPYCYRCGTALSSHEVAQGYKLVKDLAVTVEFELPDESVKTSLLAWTTTPWTLPGNVALAVNKNIDYVTVEKKDEGTGPQVRFIVAKARLKDVFGDEEYTVVAEYKGGELLGRSYLSPFDYYVNDASLSNHENGWKIYHADFVTIDTGTGIAHEAPAFGEDDMELAKREKLPVITHVHADGIFDPKVINFSGMLAKPKDNPEATDVAIIKYLAQKGLLFDKEKYEHEYPFCWRCDTPLIYFAKPSWFIRMSSLQKELLENNEKINWVPENIKEGRFGEWLRGVKDWAISRERYWGTPLPIWTCEKCGMREVISSQKELKERSGKELPDLHKPYIDDITWACSCGEGRMKRVSEVMDVWFDSGAMPLAQFSYPNHVDEDTKKIEEEKYFPADYISEAIDQTRGWFYTLHAIATLLNQAGVVSTGNAYKNVICLGHILDAQGKKMSKSKGNVIEPFQMFDEFGADPLRWMLFSINQPGLPKRFDVKGMRDVMNRVFRMLWNSYSFFVTYTSIDNWQPKLEHEGEYKSAVSENYFDQWILAELHDLINSVIIRLDSYDVYAATSEIEKFIDNLSNWYIRLNRNRFWKNEDDIDKENAYTTLHQVLVILSKIMAPFTPFISEEIYKNLTGKTSVHLANYPQKSVISPVDNGETLVMLMKGIRITVSAALQQRAKNKIKVRQPLSKVKINLPELEKVKKRNAGLFREFTDVLMKELNVKEVEFDPSVEFGNPTLDLEITPELKLEGEAREIIRAIQEGRKKAGFNVEDRIVLGYERKEKVFEKFEELIAKEVLATEVKNEKLSDAEYTETVKLEGEDFTFALKRV